MVGLLVISLQTDQYKEKLGLKFKLIVNPDAPSKLQGMAGILGHTCWTFSFCSFVCLSLCYPFPSLPSCYTSMAGVLHYGGFVNLSIIQSGGSSSP